MYESLKVLKYRTLSVYIIIHINSHELRFTTRTAARITRNPCKRDDSPGEKNLIISHTFFFENFSYIKFVKISEKTF